MSNVVYTGVICAGPDRGKMLSQSISSFSYEETSPPLFGPKRTERVTMVLYACGFVRGADNKSIVEYKGIWVPVTWDDQRCTSFLINCATSSVQRGAMPGFCG